MGLRIGAQESAQRAPGIAVEDAAVTVRPSVGNLIGAERAAGQIGIASKRRVSRCAVEKSEMRQMRVTSHRRGRLAPGELADVHQAGGATAADS